MNGVDKTTSYQGEKGISTARPPIQFRLISSHHKLFHSNIYQKTLQQNHPQQPPTTTNMSAQDIPTGEVQDNDYKSRTGQNEIPVQADDKPVEDPIDPETADSDAQLGSLQSSHTFKHSSIQTDNLDRSRRQERHRPIQHSQRANPRRRQIRRNLPGARRRGGTPWPRRWYQPCCWRCSLDNTRDAEGRAECWC
jgi:hypothetical protein